MFIDDLQCFTAVAECLNFSRAAEKLFISQPTLSKNIARLERKFHAKLFIRTKRSVRLTEAGLILQAEAPKLLRQVESIAEKICAADMNKHLCLNIAVIDTIDGILLPAIKKFRRQYPEISLNIYSGGLDQTYYMIDKQQADICITFDFAFAARADTACKNIARDDLSLALPSDHWFLADKSRDFAKLADEIFLTFPAPKMNPAKGTIYDEICSKWGFKPEHLHEVKTITSMIFSVAAGEGIAVMPSCAKQYAGKNTVFIPIPAAQQDVKISAVWKKDNLNPAAALFLNSF